MDAQKETGDANAAKGDADMEMVADDERMTDMVEPKIYVGVTPEEFEEQAHVEMHQRDRAHPHIDLSAEEYTPEEIARMLGTSLEVVMHAVWQGELKAEQKGRNVVWIRHADVVDWLRRRGPGV